jgi:hypothetical protein
VVLVAVAFYLSAKARSRITAVNTSTAEQRRTGGYEE